MARVSRVHPVPNRLDRYDIETELGRGAMGIVYGARDSALDRPVAIKILSDELAANSDVLARFEREARILASLHHPNIALIHALEEDRGVRFLVLELAVGQTLRERLRAGPLKPEDALDVCAQIAAAAEVAHDRGVVHRDLKPGNVKVADDGTVKVLDFGLATSVRKQAADEPTLAGYGDDAARLQEDRGTEGAVGTPGYMSPEQARGERVDRRSDIWALGCILYECLTGGKAFPGRTGQERIIATLRDEPDYGPLLERVPQRLRTLLMGCLDKDVARRLGDMLEVRHELQAIRRELLREPGSDDAIALTNLKRPLTSFIGRDQERADVRALLRQARLVTLTGVGGSGKTRLALAVAAALTEQMAHGVWLIELGALNDPELVAHELAAVFGVQEQSGRALIDGLCTALTGRSLLLVVDSCEHVLDECARVVERILESCPDVRVLATSREALATAGERPYQVRSLSLPGPDSAEAELRQSDAVRLFIERARPFGYAPGAGELSLVAQICRRLDGIPLAIELAAARVPVLSLDGIAARLDDRFRMLTGGSRAALPRQQTLRATFDWSWDLLSEHERELTRRLSVFAGGWTLEAAESVAGADGIDPRDVLELLTHLVMKSLVTVERARGRRRYDMLETVREYARDRLLETGRVESVRGRHRDYFLALAEEAEPVLKGAGQPAWLDRLAREHDNFRAALDWCKSHPESVEAGLRMAGALWLFWDVRGDYTEGRQHLGALLAAADDEPTVERARALNCAGWLDKRKSDYGSARDLCEQSLAAWRALGDHASAASPLNNLGLIAQNQGDVDGARRYLTECLALRREAGDRWGLAAALNNLALIAEPDDARRLLHESLAVRRELQDMYGATTALINLAKLAAEQAQLGEAREFAEQSLAMSRELGDLRTTAYARLFLASVYAQQGERGAALGSCREGLEMLRAVGESQVVVLGLLSVAEMFLCLGPATAAVRLVAASDAVAAAAGYSLNRQSARGRERVLAGTAEAVAAAELEEERAAGARLTSDQAIGHAASLLDAAARPD